MSKLFEEMAQGTAEARAYMEGERKGYKVTLPETVDVRGLRKRLRLGPGTLRGSVWIVGGCGEALGIGPPPAGSRHPRSSHRHCRRP